jgi:hypothetical protein
MRYLICASLHQKKKRKKRIDDLAGVVGKQTNLNGFGHSTAEALGYNGFLEMELELETDGMRTTLLGENSASTNNESYQQVEGILGRDGIYTSMILCCMAEWRGILPFFLFLMSGTVRM